MSMKKKLRRAFRSATPNVLDKVTRQSPMQPQPKTGEPAVIEFEQKSKLPYWLRETAATAAAFALLVGLVGGGIRLARDYLGSGSTGGTVSTEPSVTYPNVFPTVETLPIWLIDPTDEMVSICIENALSLACTEIKTYTVTNGTDDSTLITTTNSNGDTFEVTVDTAVSNDTISVTVTSEYKYVFNFGLWQNSCVLSTIEVIPTNNIKTGYITDSVAAQIATLYCRGTTDAELFTVSRLELLVPGDNADGHPVYEVDVTCPLPTFFHGYFFVIDAFTGEILSIAETGPTTSTIRTAVEARDTALEYLGLELEELRYLRISLDGLGSYIVTVAAPDMITVMVDSGGIIGVTDKVSQEDSERLSQDGHIGWRAAVDIALDHWEFDPDSLTYLDCYLYTDEYGCSYYQIEFSDSFVNYISATSSVIDGIACSTLFCYLVEVTAKGGELYDAGISAAAGYTKAIITAGQAQELALDSFPLTDDQRASVLADDRADFSWELVYDGGIRDSGARLYYVIQLTLSSGVYQCQVDAFLDAVGGSGDVEPLPPGGTISESDALNQALEAMGFTQEDAFILGITVVENSYGDFYRAHFFAAGCEYKVDIGLYGSGYIRHTAADLYDEMEHLQTLFGTMGTVYNTSLCLRYNSPAELILYYLFYNGFDDGVPLTEEETDALKDVLMLELDVFRLPASKMDDCLQTYFDISLEELDESCFAGLYYLESTDCYYMAHSDFLCTEPTFLAMTQNADGTLSIYYDPDFYFGGGSWEDNVVINDEYFVLTVKPMGGEHYVIISNNAP